MKKFAALVIALLLPLGSAQTSELAAYQMPRTQVVPIKDAKTDRHYEVYVKLPESYSEDTGKLFPVIYTTDAVWHMDLLSGTAEFLMPDAILVGISWQKDATKEIDDTRPHVSRFRDYSMILHENPDIQAKYKMGQASNHLTFIRDDVVQYIEANYRTAPGKKAYLGYSMGGSFGAYILLAKPDTFNHYILGSPAFDQRDIEYLTDMPATRDGTNTHVFVSIGEQEETKMGVTKSFMSLLQRQTDKGLSHTDLQIIGDSDHMTAVPETFMRGIKWLSKLTAE